MAYDLSVPSFRRRCDGTVVLKVTDDRACAQFRTDQASDLKNLEDFDQLMLTFMSCGPHVDPTDLEPRSDRYTRNVPGTTKGRRPNHKS